MLRVPAPLNQLPWEFAKDQFGPNALISLGLWQHYWSGSRKTSSGRIVLIPRGFPAHFPGCRKRPVRAWAILSPEQATMQLEFHQLDRRWEHLRVREPHRQRRLLASLADSGQQTPIVVVAAGPPDRYLVIDGHKRVAALEQLGRDTVEATVWAMSEAEAVLLSRSLRFSPQESALEQGWLLAEMEQRFGYSLEELARRFDRSVSWVSRRLALVELLPEAIQQQVREGKIAAQRGDEVSGAGGASRMRSIASAWRRPSSSTVATRGKPGNSIRPGAKPRARCASAFWPNRNCF